MAEASLDSGFRTRLVAVLGGRGFVFFIVSAAAFLIAFARNPAPYFERVLLTEDGNPYYNMLQVQGFWPTVSGARHDYYVLGNVALAWAAVRGCDWFSGGDPFVLPVYVSVVSYLFFGVVAALPVWLLRKRVPLGWLVAMAVLLAFLPMAREDNEVLGRISNTGFSWLTIAFLAAIRRDDLVRQPSRTGWERTEILGLDLAMAAAIATNPNCVLLLPFVLLPYARKADSLAGFLRRPGIVGAVLVVLGSLPTVSRVAFRDRPVPGSQPVAPFTLDVAAEMVGGRALLYPVVHAVYGRLTTPAVLLLVAAAVGLFLAFGRARNRRAYLLGAFVLAVSSLALAGLRPELHRCCQGFRSTYPLRYVRAQNEIVICLLVLLAWDLASNARLERRTFGLLPERRRKGDRPRSVAEVPVPFPPEQPGRARRRRKGTGTRPPNSIRGAEPVAPGASPLSPSPGTTQTFAALARLVRLSPLLLALAFFADVGGQSSFKTPRFRFEDLGDLGEQVVTALADRQFCDREARLDPAGAWLRIRTYPIVRGEPDSTVLVPRAVAEAAVWKRADRDEVVPALEVVRRSREESGVALSHGGRIGPAVR